MTVIPRNFEPESILMFIVFFAGIIIIAISNGEPLIFITGVIVMNLIWVILFHKKIEEKLKRGNII